MLSRSRLAALFSALSTALCCAALCLAALPVAAKPVLTVDFEDYPLPPNSFYDGADNAGGFTSRGAGFNNYFQDFGGGFLYWEGFALSNRTDTTTIGFANQYSAIAGSGAGGSQNFAVVFPNGFTLPRARVQLPTGAEPLSMQVTNTTYVFYALRDGDDGAGFVSGPMEPPSDHFTVSVRGLDAADNPLGTVQYSLADFRPGSGNYVLDDWAAVDLSPLQGLGVTQLEFELTTTDIGPFGPNTPMYFALDNLELLVPAGSAPGSAVLAPEPGTMLLGLVSAALLAIGWLSRRWQARYDGR